MTLTDHRARLESQSLPSPPAELWEEAERLCAEAGVGPGPVNADSAALHLGWKTPPRVGSITVGPGGVTCWRAERVIRHPEPLRDPTHLRELVSWVRGEGVER